MGTDDQEIEKMMQEFVKIYRDLLIEEFKSYTRFLESVRNLIKNAENNVYLDITLRPREEALLEMLDPELYKKYLEVRERNLKERKKFMQEILKIADQLEKRLQKYGVKVIVDFHVRGYPDHYLIFVKLPKDQQLSNYSAIELVYELEEIGLIFIPNIDIWGYGWGYIGKFGKYPPFKL